MGSEDHWCTGRESKMQALAVLVCVLGLVCGQTVLEVAREKGANVVVNLIEQQGLGGALGGEGPFTLFAPVDEAFANIPPEVLDDLTNVLLYHVVNGQVMSSDITNDGKAPTLLTINDVVMEVRTNIYPEPQVISVTGSPVTDVDNMASNGVVHLISRVMYPYPTADIVGFLSGQERFSTLVAAVVKADLVDALAGDPFSVLAPNNDAFAFAGIDVDETDAETLRNVLLYHVTAQTVYRAGLVDGAEFRSLQGSTVTVNIVGDFIVFNEGEALAVQGDLAVTNGVVVEISAVLIPPPAPQTVLDVARDLGATTVVDLISQQGLDDALRGIGPFTLFAPVNGAFEGIPPEVLDDLTNVLLGHVVNGLVLSLGMEDDETLDTLLSINDNTVQIRTNIYQLGFVYTISGSLLTDTSDNFASNGVVHLIDRVIYPYPKQSLLEILAGEERFSTLVRGVQRAGLTDALQFDGLTIFAPNNDAFEGINVDELDIDVLTAVLLYHVAPRSIFTAGLTSGSFFTMADGQVLVITIDDDGSFLLNFGDATVSKGDIIGSNGVIHEIDDVLSPFLKK